MVRRGFGRGRAVCSALAALLLAGSAMACGGSDDDAGTAASGSGDPSPEAGAAGGDEAWQAMVAAVEGVSTFRFAFEGVDGTVTMWHTDGRFSGEGEWAAGDWRMAGTDHVATSEQIQVGDQAWYRSPEPGQALDGAPWQEDLVRTDERDFLLEDLAASIEVIEQEEGALDVGFADRLGQALAVGDLVGAPEQKVDSADLEAMGSLPSDPGALTEILLQAEGGAETGRAGGLTTLAATVPGAGDLAEVLGQPLPAADLEVDVGADHLPVALRVAVGEGEGAFTLEATFAAWDEPLTIPTP
jgi:hypothetical protein